ncbi:hypothetical protein KMP13_05880 [Epibacterium ulvae]|uniref:hypothetical protein n=1 Tax=Epibacterium ulvae TaxID=1156985 RepID=UPI001BFC35B0|nr:hypothetical protein [Epibacterium ulvae]MBT8153430.1 hypothetical protein [Epibacterium ulvae]
MERYLQSNIRDWAHSEVLISAIKALNNKTADYDQAMIDTLDAQWRAEVGQSATPTITPVLSNTTADFLRNQVERSEGYITEVFIMDLHGLNVAASDTTSDFWQGDEAKFNQTYGVNAEAYHFGDIEQDESSGHY